MMLERHAINTRHLMPWSNHRCAGKESPLAQNTTHTVLTPWTKQRVITIADCNGANDNLAWMSECATLYFIHHIWSTIDRSVFETHATWRRTHHQNLMMTEPCQWSCLIRVSCIHDTRTCRFDIAALYCVAAQYTHETRDEGSSAMYSQPIIKHPSPIVTRCTPTTLQCAFRNTHQASSTTSLHTITAHTTHQVSGIRFGTSAHHIVRTRHLIRLLGFEQIEAPLCNIETVHLAMVRALHVLTFSLHTPFPAFVL